jgi:hypothetical protein
MLVVRRIVPGTGAASARKLQSVDWFALALALAICIQTLL